MSNSESPDSKGRKNEGWGAVVYLCLISAALFIIAGGILAFLDWPGWSKSEGWNDAGVRGDFWGGHFAAASGLAGTLILFAALRLQGNELKLQREELQESRVIAKQQAEALDEQTKELKAQNENLKRQIGLTESRDEIQLIMSLANEVQRLEREVDTDPHRDHLDSGAPTLDKERLESLRQNQERLIRIAARRIVLRFGIDQSNAEVNFQVFFAHLPGRLHDYGFKRMEAAILECNPKPGEDPSNTPAYSWVQKMKTLITNELL